MNTNNLSWILSLMQMGFLVPGHAAPPASKAPPAAKASPVDDPTYVLRPNDVINLEVYGQSDLSGPVRILKTGQASFPLILSVQLSGLSVEAAAKKIRDLYAEKYLVNPSIRLTVDSYAAEYVSVLCSVRNPGQVPIPVSGRIDLATAMASAGGLADDADKNAIQLSRSSGSVSTFSQQSINGAAGQTPLNPGDRIIVGKSQFIGKTVTIQGHVGKPGPIPFPLEGKLDLVTAIAYAGGITDMGNPKKLTINRRGKVIPVNFKEISQRGDLPYWLQVDDVINVPPRLF
jgi:polysaccharide export outer membrane protein